MEVFCLFFTLSVRFFFYFWLLLVAFSFPIAYVWSLFFFCLSRSKLKQNKTVEHTLTVQLHKMYMSNENNLLVERRIQKLNKNNNNLIKRLTWRGECAKHTNTYKHFHLEIYCKTTIVVV